MNYEDAYKELVHEIRTRKNLAEHLEKDNAAEKNWPSAAAYSTMRSSYQILLDHIGFINRRLKE